MFEIELMYGAIGAQGRKELDKDKKQEEKQISIDEMIERDPLGFLANKTT